METVKSNFETHPQLIELNFNNYNSFWKEIDEIRNNHSIDNKKFLDYFVTSTRNNYYGFITLHKILLCVENIKSALKIGDKLDVYIVNIQSKLGVTYKQSDGINSFDLIIYNILLGYDNYINIIKNKQPLILLN